jgi:hypothetical protein
MSRLHPDQLKENHMSNKRVCGDCKHFDGTGFGVCKAPCPAAFFTSNSGFADVDDKQAQDCPTYEPKQA